MFKSILSYYYDVAEFMYKLINFLPYHLGVDFNTILGRFPRSGGQKSGGRLPSGRIHQSSQKLSNFGGEIVNPERCAQEAGRERLQPVRHE